MSAQGHPAAGIRGSEVRPPQSVRHGFSIATGVLSTVVVVALVSVGLSRHAAAHGGLQRDLAELVSHFKSGGLEVARIWPLGDLPNVGLAVQASIEGGAVTILEFDRQQPAQWELLGSIQSTQSTDLLGPSQPAAVNAPFVLLGHREHPQAQRLLRRFHGFRTPVTPPMLPSGSYCCLAGE